MFAAEHGHTEIVKERGWLNINEKKNIVNMKGIFSLQIDKTSNHVTKLILDQEECDASIEDHDGSTAMSIAMNYNHRDIGVMLYAKMNF